MIPSYLGWLTPQPSGPVPATPAHIPRRLTQTWKNLWVTIRLLQKLWDDYGKQLGFVWDASSKLWDEAMEIVIYSLYGWFSGQNTSSELCLWVSMGISGS